MLDIEYKGGNSVVLSTKKTEVVIDPNMTALGSKMPAMAGKVEIATEERFASGIPGSMIAIEGPGDYEVGDFSIHGVAAQRHVDTEGNRSTMYRIETGDIAVAVIGNIDPKLSEDQQEELGIVDILIIPVGGGGYTLDATSATTIVRQIDPKVVIPIHFADGGLNYEVPQESLEVFTKELAAPTEQAGTKYKLKAVSSIPQVLTTVILDRS